MNLTKTSTGLLCESGRFYTFASDYIYFSPLGYEVISDSQALFETADGIILMDLTMIIDDITFTDIDVLMQYVTTPI
jgi:hypothetical protein